MIRCLFRSALAVMIAAGCSNAAPRAVSDSRPRGARGAEPSRVQAAPTAAPASPTASAKHDILIRNGVIYDGSGGEPVRGAVAINGDSIAAVGDLPGAHGRLEIDAGGLAVAPGFINMLSWANDSLIYDGRSQSDIRQGVTLEVLGEGSSMGPWNDAMKRSQRESQGDIKFGIEWTTLGEYLDWLQRRGISTNVASFVGAATVRIHELGYADRKPTAAELDRMCALVRQAMEEGAVGVSSALIYPPGAFADTDELVALAKVAARHDGMYISHIRGEGDHLLEALDEFLTIVRRAGVRGEIYHIKAGAGNWHKFDEVLRRIEAARAEGLHVTADLYPYTASATGLSSVLPNWAQDGGRVACVKRLKDPETRERIKKEMQIFEGGTKMQFSGFSSEACRPFVGKTLAEVATMRGRSPEDTAIDLLIENGRVGIVNFGISEENIRKAIRKPWVSFCSDAGSIAAEGIFLKHTPHPRGYGAFARVLARYVRGEKLVPLPEAIRRLSALPAENLKIQRRGRLAAGYFADVVVFAPAAIQDHATFTKPHQYATGVRHVFVNGVQVLKDGEHTGAKPGRAVYGPGRRQ
jgi:N-acyl-D-amino-acid deacylase